MPSDSLVAIRIDGFEKIKEKLGEFSPALLRATDKALANLGAEGRKALGQYEELTQKFNFQEEQTKWNPKTHSYEAKTRTHMDKSHGWYKASDGRRMIGFKFENAVYKYRATKQSETRARIQAISTGYAYSLMANLYYKPVRYTKFSPFFNRAGVVGYGRWKKYQTRKQRIVMTAERLNPALEPARQRTEKDIEEILRMKGLK